MAIYDVRNQEEQNWAFSSGSIRRWWIRNSLHVKNVQRVTKGKKNTHDTFRSKQICVAGEGLIFLKCHGLQIYCFGAAFR